MVVRKLVFGRWILSLVFCLTLAPAWSVFGEAISYTNGAAPIYGSPTAYGDTLLFNPTEYSSGCSGADGVDMIDGLLRVWITSSAGIGSVGVREGGAWCFFGPVTDGTQAYVGACGAELVVTAVNGVAPAGGPLIMIPGVMDFTPSSSDVGSRTFKATEGVDPAGWKGMMLFNNVDAALIGTSCQGGHVTGAMLVFDDILATASGAGTTAFIDKKWVSITACPDPDPAPEPGALVLLGGALVLGTTYQVWRRRKAELTAFYLWLVDTLEKRNRGAERQRRGRTERTEKRTGEEPVGATVRLSPQR